MDLTIFNKTENQKMSSREIAQLTGKRHDNVLRDIDNLNDSYEKLGLLKVEEGYYNHANTGNQKHREMLLTKMQTLDLMTGYKVELRIKVNRRWEELESSKNALQNISRLDLAKMLVESEEENQRLQIEAKENEHKVLFTNAVIGSESSCLIGELAKVISQNGYTIGQNRLFEWLRTNGYLGKNGERRNIPNQQYIEQGLFELKKGTRSGNDGVMHTTITPKVTGKGQVYFVNKFLATP
ncbi:phage antirepressor KilAC domain-containing protein [Elizabethkingia meningoseptica]|uniref:phage antirepressor KilAC domain-containing protein n=1 Tax=Elizabethkingia meningoseptica TaxID=238 RepID=UPI003892124D